MALIDDKSVELIKSELELFQLPPTEKTIEQYVWQTYYPLTTLKMREGEPIEFEIVTG